ncbi:MAG TPA: hypothetical protein VMW08_09590 [Acidimicrobiales bacterium]|nr:hypothetical protein [Acidimicrobiales bacterium]
MHVDEIPVAKTPDGGYGDTFPDPVLAGCSDDLSSDALDMRGLWQVTDVSVEGKRVADHQVIGSIQRIEQAGNRIVITSGGIIHDMRADGTEANGVNDVMAADLTTPISVAATFEDGVHVLRPAGLPVEIRRWRDGDELIWDYLGFTARLARLGPSEMAPPT